MVKNRHVFVMLKQRPIAFDVGFVGFSYVLVHIIVNIIFWGNLEFVLILFYTRVLQKVLSLGSDYFSATFYQTYFYYKPSQYSPFTETHFCNLFTQSQKADK